MKIRPTEKTRCVYIDYAGDFHLDLVPCITLDEECYICNNKENRFEETDGTGYRDWFNEKTRITNGNLKRVTRLLKFLRDHKGNFSVKSILLTTLIGNSVYPNDLDGGYGLRTFRHVIERRFRTVLTIFCSANILNARNLQSGLIH